MLKVKRKEEEMSEEMVQEYKKYLERTNKCEKCIEKCTHENEEVHACMVQLEMYEGA